MYVPANAESQDYWIKYTWHGMSEWFVFTNVDVVYYFTLHVFHVFILRNMYGSTNLFFIIEIGEINKNGRVFHLRVAVVG